MNAAFVYDAEGNRVKGTVGGVTTVYIAGLYEWQGGAVTKYYEGGALRRTGYATDNGVFYLVSDQVKSTSVLVNQDGTVNSRNYYYPYGGDRGGGAFSGITTKRFTGQYHEQGLPGGEGLSYYNARWYDAQLAVFISADTLVPSPLAPQSLNRYAYVGGNPLRFVDPSGHMQSDPDQGYRSGSAWWPPMPSPGPKKTYAPPYVSTPRLSMMFTQTSKAGRPQAKSGSTTSKSSAKAQYGPSRARPDDGVFLMYKVPGYFRPRREEVVTVGFKTGVFDGGMEQRHVTSLAGILDWSVYQEYDEVVGGGSAGPFGGEVGRNSNGGPSFVPSFSLGLEEGPNLTLQPGQLMLGLMGGSGGVRYGADFRWTQNRFIVTSAGTLAAAGGARAFGLTYVHKEALLVDQLGFSGGGGLSGFERAVGTGRWSSAGSLMEVIP